MDPDNTRLHDIRVRIDHIDRQIVVLWNEHAKLALEADIIKERLGQPVLNASREKEVLNNISEANQGPLPNSFLTKMHVEGMRAIRSLQRAARRWRAAKTDA